MLIKVACTCGQHYEFEVEPVNGAMPCSVVCPSCGVDGTQAANQFITQQSASAAPVPPAPVPIAAPPPSGLRISRPASSPAEPEPLSTPAGGATPPAPEPIQKRYTRTLEPDRKPPKVEPNVPLGVLGGVIAAVIAMFIWYFIAKGVGQPISFVGSLTGIFVGIGVRVLAKEGSPMLGYAAAVCAALAILGGRFLVVNEFRDDEYGLKGVLQREIKKELKKQMEVGRQAVNAKTDDEIKAWLVKNGELEHPPTAEDIKQFRETTQPMMQSMLKDLKSDDLDLGGSKGSQSYTFAEKFEYFKDHMGTSIVIWLVFGVVAAWRIGCGTD